MHATRIAVACLFATTLAGASAFNARTIPKKDTALHAIVDGNGWLLGASKNGRWVTNPSLTGTRSYAIYSVTGRVGTVSSGKPKSLDAPCPDQTAISAKLPDNAAIGIDGSWNALPRQPKSQDTNQPQYRVLVKQFLQSHGIRKPDVRIDQIIRCDLDNDGTDEVVISAHRYSADLAYRASATPEPDDAFRIHTADVKAGDYAIVLLRKIHGSQVVTIPLAGEFYPKPRPFVAPSVYQIEGMFDLKGDGRMQILLGSRYYEGEGTQVFDVRGLKAEDVLDSGCGA